MHYFPGITLKFCVSDIGLKALELGCKLLRRITMNKISNHSPAQVNKKSLFRRSERPTDHKGLHGYPHLKNLSDMDTAKISLTLIKGKLFLTAWNNITRSKEFNKRSSETRIYQLRIDWQNLGTSVIQPTKRST